MKKSNLILKKVFSLMLILLLVFTLSACEGDEELEAEINEQMNSIAAAESFNNDVDYELLDGTEGTLQLPGLIDDVIDPIYNNYKSFSFSPLSEYSKATFYFLMWSIYSEIDFDCLIRVSIVDEIVIYELRDTGETEIINGVEVPIMEKIEIERKTETVWLTDENGEKISLKANESVDYLFEINYKIADFSEKSSFTFELINADGTPIESKWAVDGFEIGASTYAEEQEE